MRRGRCWSTVGAIPTRQSRRAGTGSYRNGGGGNEAIGAFERNGPLGGSASRPRRAGITRVNVEQASKRPMWRRRCARRGMAAVARDEMETVGLDRHTSDQNPAGDRGNEDGMSRGPLETSQHGGHSPGLEKHRAVSLRRGPIPFSSEITRTFSRSGGSRHDLLRGTQ